MRERGRERFPHLLPFGQRDVAFNYSLGYNYSMITFLVSFAVFLSISLIFTIAFRAGFRDELQFVLEDLRDVLLSLYGDRL